MLLPPKKSFVNNADVKRLILSGYLPDLLPIVPPGAELSPDSTLTADKLGKTPGLWTEDGWVGFRKWSEVTMTAERLKAGVSGAPFFSIGMQSRRVHGLDVDTDNPDFAGRVRESIGELFGPYSYGMRFGREPGFLVPLRVETPRRKIRKVFMHPLVDTPSAVELLGVGQQFVLLGQHRTTLLPYRWEGDGMLINTPFAARPPMPDGDFDGALEALTAALALDGWEPIKPSHAALMATEGHSGGAGDLARDPAALAMVLEHLPNYPGNHRDRDEQVSVCHGLIGASGKSEEAREIFLRWSAQWDDSPAALHHAEVMWDTAGAVRIGWRWLAERMEAESGGRLSITALEDFAEEVPMPPQELEEDNPFEKIEADKPTFAEVEAAIDLLSTGDKIKPIIELMVQASLDKQDVEALARALAKATKVTLKTVLAEYSYVRREAKRELEDLGYRVGEQFLAEIGRRHYAYWRGDDFIFEKTHWVKQPLLGLRGRLQILLKRDPNYLRYADSGKVASIRGVLDLAEDYLHTGHAQVFAPLLDEQFAGRMALNLANGTLFISEAGALDLRPHNPADLMLTVSDFSFDPKATGPKWQAAIRDMLSRTSYTMTPVEADYADMKEACDLLGADAVHPYETPDGRLAWIEGAALQCVNVAENCRLLGEIFGYAIFPRRTGHALILHGSGRNGKSQTMRVIERIIGDQKFSRFAIESLDVDFQAVELAGVTVGCDDDAKTHSLYPDDKIKKFGETKSHSVQVKGLRNQKILIGVFMVTLCNSWPKANDLAPALRDRVLVMELNRVFARNRAAITDILSDPGERAGLLNWALAGARRYLQAGEIRESRASLQSKDVWLSASQAVYLFKRECLLAEAPGDLKTLGDNWDLVYRCFQYFQSLQGVNARRLLSKKELADDFADLGYPLRQGGGATRIKGLWVNQQKYPRVLFDFDPVDESDGGENSGGGGMTAPPQFLN